MMGGGSRYRLGADMPTVLVIDDDAAVRAVIVRTLKIARHEVLEASDGKEGVSFFAGGRIDLVVTDLFMPGQDGGSTIREIRALDAAVPIIAISGSGDDPGSQLDDAVRFGATLRMNKPFRVTELLDAVQGLLDPGSPTAREAAADRSAWSRFSA